MTIGFKSFQIRSALSPNLFYFQMINRTDPQIMMSMNDFTKNMSEYYNQYETIPSLNFTTKDCPIAGWTVACQYKSHRTNKIEWRRAKVRQKIENKIYEVLFFDFGIYDVVHYTKFRKLHFHFCSYPIQCFPGKLIGIREQSEWPKSVISGFRDFIKLAKNGNNVLALVGPGDYVNQKVCKCNFH